MRAIILAAGKGKRLAAAAGDVPKCLVRVGGRTLLDRQIQSLRACGVDDITVVVGYQAARVAAACRPAASTIENARYADTNSLYSLWLARALVGDGFVVMNADVLFHPQLLGDLLSSRLEDALIVAFRDHRVEPFTDEEMKVSVRGGCVADIAKTLPPGDADGENVGIVKFGAAGARLLLEQMERIVVAEGGVREWAPRAFQRFARLRPLHVIGTRGFPWIEIDFPEDYARAMSEVLPLIEAPGRALAPAAGLTSPAAVRAAGVAGAEWRPQPGHV
ncbi:MAG TPA: phosphocholine cytidylyltransferase family protein [Vicinamibacterales bacterium]|nr:phosphocholine cytidylyltransferase family protein [Vicinamibacterales bacterium]